jgi:uncharacterized protein
LPRCAKKTHPIGNWKKAWEYYHTPRAQYPTAPGFATARSLNQIITYDAYNKAESFLTQPLQIVAGRVAGSKWMSDDLYKRAASMKKSFHVVEGANHMSLYDVPKYWTRPLQYSAHFFSPISNPRRRRSGLTLGGHPKAANEGHLKTGKQ